MSPWPARRSTLAIFGGLVVRRHHAAIVFLLQFGDAADMVAVMVGDQNIRQRPALALQRLDDGGGFRRVDRGGRLGRGVVNQVAEIIGEAGEQADFGSHDISVVPGRHPVRQGCRYRLIHGMKYGVNASQAMRYSGRSRPPWPCYDWVHDHRRDRSPRFLLAAPRHRGAAADQSRHSCPLAECAGPARARPRLSHALSRPVPRRLRALHRLHAGGAGRAEMADGAADAGDPGRRIFAAAAGCRRSTASCWSMRWKCPTIPKGCCARCGGCWRRPAG